MHIIRNRRISRSRWRHVPEGALAGQQGGRLGSAAITVSLADWREHKGVLLGHDAPIGVRLGAGDDLADISEDLESIDLVALEFAGVTEGRGYSQARLLREQLGYRGEIRAIGDVSRDRIAFMERCGFNAYELGEDCDLQAALEAFGEISQVYQSGADGREPIASLRT